MMDAEVRPRFSKRHIHVAGHRRRPLSDLRVGELETTARPRQGYMKRLAGKFVHDRSTAALHDARYLDRRGSTLQIGLESDWQVEGLGGLTERGRHDGK